MTAADSRSRRILAIRRFNRFYTRQLGLLRRTYLDSPYSLGEARVLYEIAQDGAATAGAIARRLDLDPGYLSRLLGRFAARGLISRRVSAADARQSRLALTARGRQVFRCFEERSNRHVEAMLDRLGPADETCLAAAMATIENLLGEGGDAPWRLREPRPGDFGWIVKRHGELYAEEYGWGPPFEGLCAQITADFANRHDPRWDRCWIAERDGENIGSVFLVKESDGVARLRLLLVEPSARGLGVGAGLTQACLDFARRRGYRKVVLWTHSILKAARHIYQSAGFDLVSRERHKSWGRAVTGEHWELTL